MHEESIFVFVAFDLIVAFVSADGTTLAYGFQGGTDDSEEGPAGDALTPQKQSSG